MRRLLNRGHIKVPMKRIQETRLDPIFWRRDPESGRGKIVETMCAPTLRRRPVLMLALECLRLLP